MARVRQDRVTLCGDVVWRWYASDATARACVEKSKRRPLALMTPELEYCGCGWTRQEYLRGEHPREIGHVEDMLRALRDQLQHPACTRWCGLEQRERVMARLLRNHPEDDDVHDMVERSIKWDKLVSPYSEAYHGDPTLSNVVVQGANSLFIDHSPELAGPHEYDDAKLRRCLLVSDEGKLVGHPHEHRGDQWLLVALAGMIGSHRGEFRKLLIEVFRGVAGC